MSRAPLPFLSGVYTTSPGLLPLSKNGLPDKRIFDIDDGYDHYLSNKSDCRQFLSRHYCIKDLTYAVELSACLRVGRELARSYPHQFSFDEGQQYVLHNKMTDTKVEWNSSRFVGPSKYVSLFDAISNQVQEDMAVFRIETTRDGQRDWLAAIHLCSPNHWDPREKIGRPFPEIHRPVPAMERTVSQYKPMLDTVITKGPFARYAWGVDKDNKLNHHPAGPNQRNSIDSQDYYVRMERQHLVGLPDVNGFLFTIRTYFFDVDSLEIMEKRALATAVRSMTVESLEYKRMTPFADKLLAKLDA